VEENEWMVLTMYVLRVMSGVGRALVVVSTVLGGAMLSVGAASADGPVQVRSRLGDACLDAPSWIGDVPVVINPCNDSDFQRWNLNGRQLENVAFPGKCLTEEEKSSVLHLEMCRGAMVQHGIFSPTARSRPMLVTASPSSAALVPGPGLRLAGATAIRAKGGIALLDRRGVRRNIFGVPELLQRLVTARAASATMV
jgi:hypothetical protein